MSESSKMVLSLLQAVQDAEDVVSGLQVFEDHIPEDPELHLSVKDLVTLSQRLRSLSLEVARRSDQRLNDDVRLLLSSLQPTLRRVRDMFADTRHGIEGERCYRFAWERLCSDFGEFRINQSLSAWLGIYQLFVDDMLDALDGMQLPAGEMSRHRTWIEWMLRQQFPLQEQLDSLSIGVGEMRPRRNSVNFHIQPPPLFDALDGNTFRPHVPEVPDDFDAGSPTLSTATYSSTRTFATNSSGTLATGHWAQALLDRHLPATDFATDLGPTTYYGSSNRDVPELLQQHHFVEVAKFLLRQSSIIARFFWRPTDHRARLLISATDTMEAQLRYCATLTDLTLYRNGNLLQFCRRTSSGRLVRWVNISFPTYEQLVMFHCVYAAMKNQDHQYDPRRAVRDFPQNNPSARPEYDEETLFSALTEDGDYLHALRVYYDHDSGASRIEARPHTGEMRCCPIWTAFITDHVQLRGWALKLNNRLVRLSSLRPYVFVQGYIPFNGRYGEPLLTFRNSGDADDFIAVARWLQHRRPRV